MYLIPKELNSKIKITRHFHLKEFLLFLAGMGVTFAFDGLVYSKLVIVYYIFSGLTIAFLLLPARHNNGKYNYQAIYYTMTRKNNVFHSICSEKITNDDE